MTCNLCHGPLESVRDFDLGCCSICAGPEVFSPAWWASVKQSRMPRPQVMKVFSLYPYQ